jgi:hypothetical protein
MTAKPKNCICNWPQQTYSTGSQHREDCPVHRIWVYDFRKGQAPKPGEFAVRAESKGKGR